MSNLTQLATTAKRKAEQAERTAGRHQERVDVWQRHVNSRRPGSAAHRRAERQLRHNKKLRDRAIERAQHQRGREAGYRDRARNQPRANPRPPRRRWQPQHPIGKAVAVALISAGVVTGIAIGGANGFDPFDGGSQAAIDFEDPNAPAGPNNNGGVNNGGARTPPAASTGTETRDDPTVDDEDGPPTEGGADENNDDAPTPKKPANAPKTSTGTPPPTNTTGNTPAPVETTPAPVEATPTQAEIDTMYDIAVDECLSVLDDYPELQEIFLEGCVVDPWGTIEAIDEYLAEVHAAEEAYAAAVDNCLSTLESYPELAEQDPALFEDCHQDPAGAVELITQLAAEMAARAEFAALVEECFAQLDRYPELVEIDSNLVGRCSNDPASALATISELLDFAE